MLRTVRENVKIYSYLTFFQTECLAMSARIGIFVAVKYAIFIFLTYNYEEIIVYGLSPVHGSGHDKLQEQ